MAYGLIVLVVLLALAPLWHFMPTKRQQRQASLRETAALAGLFVEFRDLPLPARRLERLSASERQVLYYGFRLKASRGNSRSTRSWWRSGDNWEAVPRTGDPPAVAVEMPDSVLAIGLSESSCGCYWAEDGESETVQCIAALLHRWALDLESGK